MAQERQLISVNWPVKFQSFDEAAKWNKVIENKSSKAPTEINPQNATAASSGRIPILQKISDLVAW